MAPAVYESMTVTLENNGYLFRINASVIAFEGLP